MKRYDPLVDFDSQFMGMDDDPNGQWVPASVAQSLYDALKGLAKESDVWAKVVPAYQNSKPLSDARKALSLADGESE